MSVCTEVPVFLTDTSEEILTLEASFHSRECECVKKIIKKKKRRGRETGF